MIKVYAIITMLAIGAAAGLTVMFIEQSVNAWHSLFESKKECVNFMKNSLGNTNKEANVMCQKVVPH